MNKNDLLKIISKKTGLMYDEVFVVINAMIEEIVTKLLNGEEVKIHNFGTFTRKKYMSKVARNLSNNTCLEIPNFYKITFKTSDKIKKKLNSMM